MFLVKHRSRKKTVVSSPTPGDIIGVLSKKMASQVSKGIFVWYPTAGDIIRKNGGETFMIKNKF